MDGELKAILWSMAVIVAGVVAAQIFYPGGIGAFLHIFAK